MTARWLWLWCAPLALAAAACVDSRDGAQTRSPAPDFAHTDLDGRTVRLSELRGRTVVIDLWATWCEPCVYQPPELNQVWKAHRASGKVVVLGVELGGASPDEIRTWGEENGAIADYPLLWGADEDLARRFGAMGFPATVVIDPQGAIDSVTVGLATAAEIEQAIAHVVGP